MATNQCRGICQKSDGKGGCYIDQVCEENRWWRRQRNWYRTMRRGEYRGTGMDPIVAALLRGQEPQVQEGFSSGKVFLFLAVVGGGVYFLTKNYA